MPLQRQGHFCTFKVMKSARERYEEFVKFYRIWTKLEPDDKKALFPHLTMLQQQWELAFEQAKEKARKLKKT